MEPVIHPIDRNLLMKELNQDKFIRETRKGGNEIYEVTAHDSPNTMLEIGRLREIAFRMAGGGTGKSTDIDDFDKDLKNPYRQLVVWDPKDREIVGGYRYIKCKGLRVENLATHELFKFSDRFVTDYLPHTIELGRSFVQPNYQGSTIKAKGLYALDNLWDGLGALIIKNRNIKYFLGKVTMYTSYNLAARNTLLNFLHKYFNDADELLTPIKPIDYDSENPIYTELFHNLDYATAYKTLFREVRALGENIPPLINSYMNLSPSMRVFGSAINETFGQVEETGLIVNIKDIYPEKIERHISPVLKLAVRLRSKWWKSAKNKRLQKETLAKADVPNEKKRGKRCRDAENI